MAASKNKKRKKGGRKLEFAIYIIGALVVCLALLGIIKAIKNVFSDDKSNTEEASSNVSSSVSEPSQPAVSQPEESTVSAVSSNVSSEETVSEEESEVPSSSVSSSASSSDQSEKPSANAGGDYVTTTKTGADELSEWYLLLVNPETSISSDWITNMTDVGGEQLDSRIVGAYWDMVNAAADDGVTIYAISGYRSYSTQQRLYNNRVERAKNENPSFTQQEAEDYAATHVARPGTSEHQTGLAIDFNSVETSFGDTAAGKWLKANAHKYGFILRYEKDKQHLTGVTWEPWHYRFVGVKHATKITEMGICFEEYVEYLKNGGQ